MAGIFINYRRDDAPGVAGRLGDRLAQNFSQRDIFMDVDAMKPGLDFVKQLDEQVAKCAVFLAIIGPGWLKATDEKGRRKLDLPRDYVRIELACALKREIPVIPVLVNGAAMPTEDDLPDDLKPLTNRHALELRHTRFAADSEAIVRALHSILPRPTKWLRIVGSALAVTCILACIAWWVLPLGRNESNTPVVSTAKTTTRQALSSSADNRTDKLAPSLPESSKPSSTSSTPTSAPAATSVPTFPIAPSRLTPGDNRGDRIAIVIGNAKYPDAEAPLKEPIDDARDLADELKRDGFNVEVGENLTGDAMRRAFDKFYGRIKPGSVALIFFSGFGIQSGRQSYMIPVDAQIWTEPDLRRDAFSLETVLSAINDRGAAVKIALIDASRRNPFERRFRSFSAGLAPVIAPNGTLVMYSAALSSVISDNGGDHGLFVQELLKQIRVPGLMAEETFNRTRVEVTKASRSDQVPWISSSLAEDFSFNPSPTARN